GYRMRVNGAVKSQLFYNGGAFSYGTTLDGLAGNTDILSRTGDVYLSTVSFKSHGLVVKYNTGYVGIGTTSPGYLFDVNGNGHVNDHLIVGNITYTFPSEYRLAVADGIITERLKIKTYASGWPDYVFKSNYNLPKLEDIDEYIRQNNHLPEIASEEEVKKDGIELGDMNAKLLKKIEELTLYMIDANKQIKQLQQEVNALKEKK
ncbi:MAG TPA: hypothetical protein VKH37_00285, partial [Ferruginibacter sp.]|nr:hypothetical protein [Ferruginibacter sp.]